MSETRPALSAGITTQELGRWYWLASELAGFARQLGVSPTGGKQELTERITAHLDGTPPPRRTVPRPRAAAPLAEPLESTTRLPPGQRCTQQLRRYLTAVIGPTFRFDAAMRDFVADGAGLTLGAAVDHWYSTRSGQRPPIGAQFELNRFLREWHQRHPEGSRDQALVAWHTHRDTPVEARGSTPPDGQPAEDRSPDEVGEREPLTRQSDHVPGPPSPVSRGRG